MGNREFEEVLLLFAKEHTTGSGSLRLIRKIGGYFYHARQPEIDALKAEVERLRKDAERYQWLRDKEPPVSSMHHLQHAPSECDLRIDAAMKETK